MLIHKDDRLQ